MLGVRVDSFLTRWSPLCYRLSMPDTPPGFKRRKGARLLRTHLDLPESLAVAVADIAAQESEATGERVSVQGVLRRLVREALSRRGPVVPRSPT